MGALLKDRNAGDERLMLQCAHGYAEIGKFSSPDCSINMLIFCVGDRAFAPSASTLDAKHEVCVCVIFSYIYKQLLTPGIVPIGVV